MALMTEAELFCQPEFADKIAIDVKGDGACGFRAASVIINGHEDGHSEIRRDVVKYLVIFFFDTLM